MATEASLQRENTTIAALATPPGDGGLAVIRLSGAEALTIAAKGFRGSKDLSAAPTHTAHFGAFHGPDGRKIDDVVAVVFRQPRSYTGEDTVELSCHGGFYVSQEMVRGLIAYGARHAEPGEFTKRAFLNGRMDLTQAEAVADLIHCRSALAHQVSLKQLGGSLSSFVRSLRSQLVDISSLLELELDFTEEGYEFVDRHDMIDRLTEADRVLGKMLETFQAGKVIREGVTVAIVGRPNVGKSSLLNRLLKEDRAIVTDIAGTTRDTIEEAITIRGLTFQLTDTAGLRAARDIVEQEGVRRAERQVRGSRIVILVFDRSRSLTDEDASITRHVVGELRRPATAIISVLNKIDLPDGIGCGLPSLAESMQLGNPVPISCRTGEGIEALQERMVHCVAEKGIELTEGSVVVTNLRHFEAFEKARMRLENALTSAKSGQSSELVAVDLRVALDVLGEIIGEVTAEDILNNIFSHFCIGK